ncbi:hypothetical protein HGA34_02980 [Candidatus Falkowbacteria bacterium]|nr:hypothetical protein [Candidatus Falkowbacteria bacterium]
MKNILNKKIVFLLIWGCILFNSASANALSLISDQAKSGMFNQQKALRETAGYESTTKDGVATIVATAIKAFIGLLGIIFVVLIVYSGYSWMTAGGDETKITKAKNTISRAVIGLIIVLAAYSITYFVFSNLDSVVDSGGGGMTGSP